MIDAKREDGETAVDDVRKIREAFARESHGDIRVHAQRTLAEFEKLAEGLNLKVTNTSKK